MCRPIWVRTNNTTHRFKTFREKMSHARLIQSHINRTGRENHDFPELTVARSNNKTYRGFSSFKVLEAAPSSFILTFYGARRNSGGKNRCWISVVEWSCQPGTRAHEKGSCLSRDKKRRFHWASARTLAMLKYRLRVNVSRSCERAAALNGIGKRFVMGSKIVA